MGGGGAAASIGPCDHPVESKALWYGLCQYYLDRYLLDAALFYAERLHYEASNDMGSINLLAQCYLRMGKVKQAYLILQQGIGGASSGNACDVNVAQMSSNKYLFAVACTTLEKFQEAESTLLSNFSGSPAGNLLSLEKLRSIPGGAAGTFLLGRICRLQHRKEAAVHYLSLALKLDPYLWCAVEQLSEMGEGVDAKSMFANSPRPINSSQNAAPPALRSESAVPMLPVRSGSIEKKCLGDEVHLKQLSVAEELSSPGVISETTSHAYASPGNVSASLGLSSMALRVPFASPNGISPSPYSILLQQERSYHKQQQDLRKFQTVSAHKGDTSTVSAGSLYYQNIYGTNNSYFEAKANGIDYRQEEPSGDVFNDTSIQLSMGSSSVEQSHGSNPRGRDPRATLFASATPAAESSLCGVYGEISRGSDTHHVHPEGQLFSVSPAPPPVAATAADDKVGNTAAFKSSNVKIEGGVEAGSVVANGRRVSFGPTARLSFSGAFDASSPGQQRPQITSGRLDNDEHPNKLQKMTPGVNNADEGNKTLSPFAIESSPIPPGTDLLNKSCEDSLSGGKKLVEGIAASHDAVKKVAASIPFTAVQGTQNPASVDVTNDPMAEAERHINSILAVFVTAYQHLCLYRCQECINTLHTLPRVHLHSALVSQWIGRAYYEMNEYKPAMLAFREMLKSEPYRIKGMETLSTALWHLKLDRELSALAQQVVDIDRLAPETWCVVGNCFSLQKEPEAAVKFFHRALQIDSQFTYAHTLCGHEQVSNEDMDKAIDSFRQALLTNDRHYNAWYGLGSIYYRQERFELAEFHFRQALQLNPASSVLHCYLGMALHAQGSSSKTTEALEVLGSACEKDHRNPQLHFQRAHILASEDELEEAIEALQIVAEYAPKEPPVHALLGQVYHQRGDLQLALRHFNIAMDLDPKEAASLKAIMENLEEAGIE